MDALETKPCTLCDKPLESACDDWDTMQPYGGGELVFEFAYGSCKFDKNIGVTEYRGLICDECAEKFVAKMREVS